VCVCVSFVSFSAVCVERAIRAEEGPRVPTGSLLLLHALLPRVGHTQRRGRTSSRQEAEGRDKECAAPTKLGTADGRPWIPTRGSRRSLVTMQASLMAIGLLLALYSPLTCALISRSRFSRPSALRAPPDCKQTPRSMVTSLATAKLNQPEPPAVKSAIDVGQLAILALMVVFLIIQMSQGSTQVSQGATLASQSATLASQGAALDALVKMQAAQGAALDALVKMQVSQGAALASQGATLASQGATLASQGQMLTALSTKFDQVSYFVVGVIALATFGSSVVSILKYVDDIKQK
jgi:hypothetical protein